MKKKINLLKILAGDLPNDVQLAPMEPRKSTNYLAGDTRAGLLVFIYTLFLACINNFYFKDSDSNSLLLAGGFFVIFALMMKSLFRLTRKRVALGLELLWVLNVISAQKLYEAFSRAFKFLIGSVTNAILFFLKSLRTNQLVVQAQFKLALRAIALTLTPKLLAVPLPARV